mmetsp:Transcript_31603/g.48324  ORF Transcript_31603/g.48324 Transcript_31603/m.48324 type:complete len:197 (-) Transcript_31603:28-618(-)
MAVFSEAKQKVTDLGLKNLRIRGLKVETRMESAVHAKIEVLCDDENGIIEFQTLLNETKDRIHFTYVRLMGDSTHQMMVNKVKVGQRGMEAIIEMFQVGHFKWTYEFRFYNFDPEPTPMIAYVDSLVNNPTLQTIGFARNGLNQDMCAAILQRLYYNPVLKCLDFNGNQLTVSQFQSEIVKKYFNSRGDEFRIIVD